MCSGQEFSGQKQAGTILVQVQWAICLLYVGCLIMMRLFWGHWDKDPIFREVSRQTGSSEAAESTTTNKMTSW